MAGSSDSSFIPKRGPVTKKRRVAPRQVYLLTLISYITMFTSLLAAGGVYLYGDYIARQLNSEVTALNQEIAGFSEADMERVIEFDLRLQQAAGRLNSSPSFVSVFKALESVVVDTAMISSLEIERQSDESLLLTADFETETFDSTIFQRDTFTLNDVIDSASVSDASLTQEVERSEEGLESEKNLVTFKAELSIPISEVLYEANANNDLVETLLFDAELSVSDAVTSSTTDGSLEGEVLNQDSI